uniref:Jacalin-type lectin domain-containing protein n=1 Tax=Terrapene triunguis TaxID=2587831 RepID=A0A674JKC9_9SAUR
MSKQLLHPRGSCSSCPVYVHPITASVSGLMGDSFGRDCWSHHSNESLGRGPPPPPPRVRLGGCGIQVRYGNAWSSVNGAAWGTLVQMDLEPCESIVQVQGSYSYWVVTSLTFTTSLGRTFLFGNQSGGTFLALPPAPGSVLRAVSGRAGSYLYAIGFHWGAPPAKGAPCSA